VSLADVTIGTHPLSGPDCADAVEAAGTFAAGSRTVDVHISRLRHKLGSVYGACLVTEHRAGYRFRPLPL
jgi:DNA-binding response OmpR family regulator